MCRRKCHSLVLESRPSRYFPLSARISPCVDSRGVKMSVNRSPHLSSTPHFHPSKIISRVRSRRFINPQRMGAGCNPKRDTIAGRNVREEGNVVPRRGRGRGEGARGDAQPGQDGGLPRRRRPERGGTPVPRAGHPEADPLHRRQVALRHRVDRRVHGDGPFAARILHLAEVRFRGAAGRRGRPVPDPRAGAGPYRPDGHGPRRLGPGRGDRDHADRRADRLPGNDGDRPGPVPRGAQDGRGPGLDPPAHRDLRRGRNLRRVPRRRPSSWGSTRDSISDT